MIEPSDAEPRHAKHQQDRLATDRWDRRFRIEGHVIEAIRLVLDDRSEKNSEKI